MSGSGISWDICKSAPRSRQITMPAPHHSVFTGRMPFLPPNQQCQSTEASSEHGVYMYSTSSGSVHTSHWKLANWTALCSSRPSYATITTRVHWSRASASRRDWLGETRATGRNVHRILVRGSIPLAAWGEENFEKLTRKWCILEYTWKNMWPAQRHSLHLPALIALKI